jgi:hypothetical protein
MNPVNLELTDDENPKFSFTIERARAADLGLEKGTNIFIQSGDSQFSGYVIDILDDHPRVPSGHVEIIAAQRVKIEE